MPDNQVVDFSGNSSNLISNVSNLIENVVNQYIVSPLGSNSLSGYIFDIIGDEEMALDSEITDHYLENNFSIQDHVALRPEEFTVKGYVGELTDAITQSSLSVVSQVIQLGTLGGLNPGFAAQAQQTYNKISSVTSQVTQAYNQAQNFFNIFTQSSTSYTKQQQAYQFFYSMWMSRTLFTVQTPYAVYPNPSFSEQKGMVIKSLRVIQRDDNKYVSDFSVTFKMIRVVPTNISTTLVSNPLGSATATTSSSEPSGNNIQGRALSNALSNNPTNLGDVTGVTTTPNGTDISTLLLSPPQIPSVLSPFVPPEIPVDVPPIIPLVIAILFHGFVEFIKFCCPSLILF